MGNSDKGAKKDIEGGDLKSAVKKLRGTWTSLPGGSQSRTTLADAKQKFDLFVSEEIKKLQTGQDKE